MTGGRSGDLLPPPPAPPGKALCAAPTAGWECGDKAHTPPNPSCRAREVDSSQGGPLTQGNSNLILNDSSRPQRSGDTSHSEC